jgi:hypothetical protein
MLKNIMIGICAITLALSGAACSRSTFSTRDGAVTVEQKGKGAGSMIFTGKNGEKVAINMNGGKVPEDYPKDVPVYEGTKVVMSQSATEKNTHNLVLESSDAPDKITEYYKKGLESNGWKTEGTMNMGEMNMISASKAKRQVVVQVANAGEKRTITQITSDKQ